MTKNRALSRLKKIYWIFGKSCSGKTTAAKYLEKEYGFYYFDGDKMLNIHANNVKNNDDYPITKKRMNSGHDDFLLLPEEFYLTQAKLIDELTDLLVDNLIELTYSKKNIIFDGDINYRRLVNYISHSKVLYIDYQETIDINDFDSRDNHNIMDFFKNNNIDEKKTNNLVANFNSILESNKKKDMDIMFAKKNNWYIYNRKETDKANNLYNFLKEVWINE